MNRLPVGLPRNMLVFDVLGLAPLPLVPASSLCLLLEDVVNHFS